MITFLKKFQPSIITRHGYKFEGLKAKTEDGYYLSVFRIPGNGIPVLLVHTYLWSSASFVSQIDKNNSLGKLVFKLQIIYLRRPP